jgi:hypothetical protein
MKPMRTVFFTAVALMCKTYPLLADEDKARLPPDLQKTMGKFNHKPRFDEVNRLFQQATSVDGMVEMTPDKRRFTDEGFRNIDDIVQDFEAVVDIVSRLPHGEHEFKTPPATEHPVANPRRLINLAERRQAFADNTSFDFEDYSANSIHAFWNLGIRITKSLPPESLLDLTGWRSFISNARDNIDFVSTNFEALDIKTWLPYMVDTATDTLTKGLEDVFKLLSRDDNLFSFLPDEKLDLIDKIKASSRAALAASTKQLAQRIKVHSGRHLDLFEEQIEKRDKVLGKLDRGENVKILKIAKAIHHVSGHIQMAQYTLPDDTHDEADVVEVEGSKGGAGTAGDDAEPAFEDLPIMERMQAQKARLDEYRDIAVEKAALEKIQAAIPDFTNANRYIAADVEALTDLAPLPMCDSAAKPADNIAALEAYCAELHEQKEKLEREIERTTKKAKDVAALKAQLAADEDDTTERLLVKTKTIEIMAPVTLALEGQVAEREVVLRSIDELESKAARQIQVLKAQGSIDSLRELIESDEAEQALLTADAAQAQAAAAQAESELPGDTARIVAAYEAQNAPLRAEIGELDATILEKDTEAEDYPGKIQIIEYDIQALKKAKAFCEARTKGDKVEYLPDVPTVGAVKRVMGWNIATAATTPLINAFTDDIARIQRLNSGFINLARSRSACWATEAEYEALAPVIRVFDAKIIELETEHHRLMQAQDAAEQAAAGARGRKTELGKQIHENTEQCEADIEAAEEHVRELKLEAAQKAQVAAEAEMPLIKNKRKLKFLEQRKVEREEQTARFTKKRDAFVRKIEKLTEAKTAFEEKIESDLKNAQDPDYAESLDLLSLTLEEHAEELARLQRKATKLYMDVKILRDSVTDLEKKDPEFHFDCSALDDLNALVSASDEGAMMPIALHDTNESLTAARTALSGRKQARDDAAVKKYRQVIFASNLSGNIKNDFTHAIDNYLAERNSHYAIYDLFETLFKLLFRSSTYQTEKEKRTEYCDTTKAKLKAFEQKPDTATLGELRSHVTNGKSDDYKSRCTDDKKDYAKTFQYWVNSLETQLPDDSKVPAAAPAA